MTAVRAFLRHNCGGGSLPLHLLQAEMEKALPEACAAVVSRWTEYCLHNSIKVFSYTDAETEQHKLSLLVDSAPAEQRVTLQDNMHYIEADRNLVSALTSHEAAIFEAVKAALAVEGAAATFWEDVTTKALKGIIEEGSEYNARVVVRNLCAHNAAVVGSATIPPILITNIGSTIGSSPAPSDGAHENSPPPAPPLTQAAESAQPQPHAEPVAPVHASPPPPEAVPAPTKTVSPSLPPAAPSTTTTLTPVVLAPPILQAAPGTAADEGDRDLQGLVNAICTDD